MTDLSIIVISYNTKVLTEKCLETIISSLHHKSTITAEIIVIDNNSNDGSVEMLKDFHSSMLMSQSPNIKLKTIFSKSNLGYAKGNNEAVKRAEGKIILFLNSDIEVLADAIPKLYQFFVNQKRFQFIGGKLFNQDITSQASCGPDYSLPIVFTALFLRGDYYGLTRYSPNQLRQVDWVSGACFICKKTDFENISGFDNNIFMYMDEIDLFFRARKHQLIVGFYPDAQFIHIGSGSSHGRTQPILQVFKGLIYFYKKHHRTSAINFLKFMLKLKALVACRIGRLLGNQYLISTYAKAYKIVDNN